MDIRENQQSICRTCLCEKENMKNIFNIAEILMTFTPIQIEHDDGLPTTICSECVTQVNQAYEFRLQCEQSDDVLRKKLLNEQIVLINTDRFENNSPETFRENSFSPDLIKTLNNDELKSLADDRSGIISKKHRRLRKTRKRCINIIKKCTKEITDEKLKNVSDTDGSNSSLEEENSTELSCSYCDMKFRYKIRLKKHEQKHLTGLKCHLCGKDFPTMKQLTNHVNIHSRKGVHLCQTCGKKFTLPENLVRHQRIHSGTKPYKCQLCNKSFTQSNELKSHLISHSSEKHHLCNICGNKYSRSVSLRVHMRRIHSFPANYRPYICAVCGRNFKDRRDLSQHMLIHTGERSHVCNVCGKAFNRSSNLRVHEKIHSGHKPHVCPVCQRAFIQKHVLITHMRTHPHSQIQLPTEPVSTTDKLSINKCV